MRDHIASQARPLRFLLPQPRKISRRPDVCRVGTDCSLQIDVDDKRVQAEAFEFQARLPNPQNKGMGAGAFHIQIDRALASHPDSYQLTIRPNGIDLIGGSPAGCFYGLKTLSQLMRAAVKHGSTQEHGANGESREPCSLPCVYIEDWPDFAARGVLLDVTRGRVPTVEFLKKMIDRLSEWKINQVHLYIEHAFVFSFDPDICTPEEGLTPEEIGELDPYAKNRFIDLVPALAAFGHMGRILSMPKYRHLAEIEATKDWLQMAWPERMRGFTLDCVNPQSHKLVEAVWSNVLDAFSSPVVNVCGDEPWDLGRGKNQKWFKIGGIGQPYVEQLVRTHRISSARGRRTQFWSDVIRKFPRLIHDELLDSTILHWGYDAAADYEGTYAYTSRGLETFVCPGTSGWKRVLNAMNLAEGNISTFAAVGKRLGASGLLNTDWGDHGHFNMPGTSRHGLSLGAALSWNVGHVTGVEFDDIYALTVLGVSDVWDTRRTLDTQVTQGVKWLREASQIGEEYETWRLMWMPLGELYDRARFCNTKNPGAPGLACAAVQKQEGRTIAHGHMADDITFPPENRLNAASEAAHRAAAWCGGVREQAIDPVDLDEIRLACRFTELCCEKLLMGKRLLAGKNADHRGHRGSHATALTTSSMKKQWLERLDAAVECYRQLWFLRSKPYGVSDVVHALQGVKRDVVSHA